MSSTPLDLRSLAASLPNDDSSPAGEASHPTPKSNAIELADCESASIPPHFRRKFSPPVAHAEETILPARAIPEQEMHFTVLQGGLRAHAINALRQRETALSAQNSAEVALESR
jgi:hypothetical protein